MLSRFGEHGGCEIACKDEDAYLVWDRIAKAGRPYALRPAGLDAMDIADLEAGVPRPGRDYDPATAPSPVEMGLESLVDPDHAIFNGRAGYLALPRTNARVGVELDGERPAPHAPFKQGGRTLHSLYSPALRRAIALAVVDTTLAAPGTALALANGTAARVCALPFLS
jgi:aminomethyltransferase